MIWDLEHQEEIVVSDRGANPTGSRRLSKTVLLYVAMAAVPVAVFAVMLVLARH